jgi:hypothetical protein
MELDEFSKEVIEAFNWLYDLGHPIDAIFNKLIHETRVSHLSQLAIRPLDKTIKVKKTLWKIKLPLVKYYETYDYKGELKSRFKINWTKENLIKLAKAKSKDEEKLIFSFLFIEREYLYQKPVSFNSKIIDPEETNKSKWFKALVKYKANKEFLPEIYLSELPPNEQKVLTETKEKRKRDTTKLVKWTDGKNKNSFVKLIYALHHSNLLDKGEGEVTNTVEALAPIFGLELNDWESNFSKGITEQGYTYDHGAFFEDLKKSYLKIVETKLESKKIRKKIMKEIEKQDSKESD